MTARLRAPPACGPKPAALPGWGAPSAALGAYDEPDDEPDVSATLSAAERLRERLAAAPLVLRTRPAGDRPGAVSCCPAECAGMTAVSPLARARWNTRVLSWVTWPSAVVCTAAPARRGCRMRMLRSRCASKLAMQDLPRGPVQSALNRADKVASHVTMPFRCNTCRCPVLALPESNHR